MLCLEGRVNEGLKVYVHSMSVAMRVYDRMNRVQDIQVVIRENHDKFRRSASLQDS